MRSTRKQIKSNSWQEVSSFLGHHFNIVILLLITIILASGFIFLLRPKYYQINYLVKMEGEKTKEDFYQEQVQYLSQLQKINDSFKNITIIEKERLDNILPVEDIHEVLLPQIESLVLKNGLLITSISIESENDDKKQSRGTTPKALEEDTPSDVSTKIKKMRINLKIVGVDYQGLKNLLVSLENNLRLMDVDNIEFIPDSNSAKISLLTYYLE